MSKEDIPPGERYRRHANIPPHHFAELSTRSSEPLHLFNVPVRSFLFAMLAASVFALVLALAL